MVDRIPQHRHCHYCDKAIPSDKQYCDENCEQRHAEARKKKKKQLQTFYALMIVIFVFAVVLSLM
jgi:predicted nucleic acid-binding Zn ribbon protein